MKKEYNLKKMKRAQSPSWSNKELKVIKTIRLDLDIVSWLLREAAKRGIPYQTLINSLLKESMNAASLESSKDRLRREIREIVKEELKRAS